MVTITDAYGRNISELVPCSRCGHYIKYQYNFDGKLYGSECIKVVTGQPLSFWIVSNGKINKQATADREADREAKRLQTIESNNKREAELLLQIRKYSDENNWLINVLKNQWQSTFIEDMIWNLQRMSFTDLTANQQNVIANIYAKQFGRFNSKNYKKAMTDFEEKINNG